MTDTGSPKVIQIGALDMQVCVPTDWSDEQVIEFANRENPCGTTGGWFIRKKGSKYLQGAPERRQCEERAGYVHIMLDA